MNRCSFVLWLALLLAAPQTLQGGRTGEIVIDCSRRTGVIRPLHGVNNGPLNFGGLIDLSAYYRELEIPLARLHDCEYPTPDVVDIHVIFPDFEADASAAENYNFARTDEYVRAIVEAGTGIVYRLGESIEHTRRKYHVHPPADVEKWAKACTGVIRHYNEGWADGFHHDIRYWEIWNEPENRPNMWTGGDEDYYKLYSAAARAIKAEYPDLKVGGPSAGYQGRFSGDTMEPSEFLKGFLTLCRDEELPLDFFSWHTYTNDPTVYVSKARALRKLLDDFGFVRTEMHLNEWNYLPDNDWTAITLAGQGLLRKRWFARVAGAEGAAFTAGTLVGLQDSPVDVANYYSGDTNLFGLFDRYGAPRKTYYAMKAFKMLLDTPNRLMVSGSLPESFTVCAGANEDTSLITILLSNLRADRSRFLVKIENTPGDFIYSGQRFDLDDERDLRKVSLDFLTDNGIAIAVKAPSVTVLRLKKH